GSRNRAVREEQEGRAQRCAARGGSQFGGRAGKRLDWYQRLKCWQGNARPEAAQEGATAPSGLTFGGDLLIRVHDLVLASARWAGAVGLEFLAGSEARVFWNGADSMTPASNSDGLPFDFSRRATIVSTVATS